MKLRMQWKLVIIFTLLILLSMQFMGVYFTQNLKSYYLNNFSLSLNSQAQFLTFYLTPYLDMERSPEREDIRLQDIDHLVSNLTTLNGIEVQVIGPDGVVLATTLEDKWVVGQKNNQPEVNRALHGVKEESIRIMPTTGERVKIIALPIKDGPQVLGAVFLIASMEEVYGTIHQIGGFFYTGTAIALILTGLIGIVIARTITNPIQEVTRHAAAIAEGDFSHQVAVKSADEIGQLGLAFNYMSNRLQNAISVNIEERKKLASILTNMNDGVIAASPDGKIILMNPRASQMLLQGENWRGKTIYECLHLPEDMEYDVLFEQEGSFLMDVPIKNKRHLTLRVTISHIYLGGEEKKGIIAVLSDVTEQEKIEKDRKEFVANVSHELRTPLTTMKSYLESLLDGGAIEDRELATSFLKVVQNETERMIRLVSDLLLLSRLDSNESPLQERETDVHELIKEVLNRFNFEMKKQGIVTEVITRGSPDKIPLDRDKMHQVFDNLISNAIKYTSEQGKISLLIDTRNSDWVEVRITDQGIGIPEKDLERIFERFYRVDKGRSRSMGGTGLGLSIASEIVELHGGRIEIESEVNVGTTVNLFLPKKGREQV